MGRQQNSVLTLLILAACSDAPSRERFPGGQGATTDVKSGTQGAVMGGFDPNQAPVDGNAAAAPKGGASLRGRVSLASKVKLRPGMILFISARPLEGGPPLAVKRIEAPQFPFDFELTAQDAMMAGRPLEGEVMLSARLSQSGNPLERTRGDASGGLKARVGDPPVKLEINHVE